MLRKNKIWQTFVKHIIVAGFDSPDQLQWRDSLLLLESSPETFYNNAVQNEQTLALEQALDLKNVISQFSFYSELYFAINSYFLGLGSHHQHKELKDLYTNWSEPGQLVHIWTLTLFITLSQSQPVVALEEKFTTHVCAALIERASLHCYVCCELAARRSVGINLITIKKYMHIFLHLIAETSPERCRIQVQEKETILDVKEFLNTVTPSPAYASQITVFQLSVDFETNYARRYFISNKPAKIITIGKHHYTYFEHYFGAQQLIVQHYAKEQTVIEPLFLSAVRCLAETQFVIDSALVKQVELFVQTDTQQLWQQIEVLTGEDCSDIYTSKAALGIAQRQRMQIQRVRAYLQNLLANQLKEPTEDLQIQQLVYKTNLNARLIRAIFNKNKTEQQLFADAQILQQAFSHLSIYESFLAYKEHLEATDFEKVYFMPYCDFRGRLYYKGEASIQSMWCFRFLYYYSSRVGQNTEYPLYTYQNTFLEKHNSVFIKNKAALEFLHGIGIIFKSDVIDRQTGRFELADILEHGYKKYLQYKHYNWLQNSEKLSLKDLMELYYYIYAFDSEQMGVNRAYYIWKDTTASVIQHGGKLLGYRLEMLDKLNLNNTFTAYDTYQVVINHLIRRLEAAGVTAEILQLLNRKVLKQLIMTCEYQVTWQTAYGRYLSVIKSLFCDSPYLPQLESRKVFDPLFKALKEGLVADLFYCTSQSTWYDVCGLQSINYEDLCLSPKYYKTVYKSLYYDMTKNGKRRRAVVKTIVPVWETKNESLELNTRKSKQAAYVNFVHAHDALYLRRILCAAQQSHVEIAAVHDGFAVAYYNAKWLVGAANNSFWVDKVLGTSLSIVI